MATGSFEFAISERCSSNLRSTLDIEVSMQDANGGPAVKGVACAQVETTDVVVDGETNSRTRNRKNDTATFAASVSGGSSEWS